MLRYAILPCRVKIKLTRLPTTWIRHWTWHGADANRTNGTVRVVAGNSSGGTLLIWEKHNHTSTRFRDRKSGNLPHFLSYPRILFTTSGGATSYVNNRYP